MQPPTATLSVDDLEIADPQDRAEGCLFLAFECQRLLAGPARHLLGGIQTVTVGRGPVRRAELDDSSGVRRLAITVPDRRISSVHLTIRRVGGGWELTDAGAKNGTFV